MERISLARGVPSVDLVPADAIRQATSLALQDPQRALSYTDPAGMPGLRSWIAGREDGLADEVLVTNGSLQALDFVARTLLKPQDRVIVESPTYDYTIEVFRRAGVRLTGIRVQPDGLDVGLLEQVLRRDGPPAALYVIPTFQNPTGVCLSTPKRHRLADLAREWGFMIIEDDPYRQLRFDGQAAPTLRSLCSDGTVLHLTSFTKTIAPGLRCGAAIGPTRLIERLADAARHAYISPGAVAQAIVEAYCLSGLFDTGVDRIVDQLIRRRDALVAALEYHLAGHIHITTPQGGYFLWASLDRDSQTFTAQAQRAGVDVVAGNQFFLDSDKPPAQAVRLAFAAAGVDDVEEAAARLATCLRDPSPPSPLSRLHKHAQQRPHWTDKA